MLIGILTAVTLVAFAANSLLCRMALGGGLIDPVSFTALRLVSGAIVLVPLSGLAARSGTGGGSYLASPYLSGATCRSDLRSRPPRSLGWRMAA